MKSEITKSYLVANLVVNYSSAYSYSNNVKLVLSWVRFLNHNQDWDIFVA